MGRQSDAREQVPGFQKLYPDIYAKGVHTMVKPGD